MSRKAKQFGVGMLLGAAAGVVAGFLTAPKPGKEIRKDVAKKASEAKDFSTQKADTVAKPAADVAQKIIKSAKTAVKNVENSVKKSPMITEKDIEKSAEDDQV
jgi:gas vesicle protein